MRLTRRQAALKAWLGFDGGGAYEKVFLERVRMARFGELAPISPERARDLEELAAEAEDEAEHEGEETPTPESPRAKPALPVKRRRGRTISYVRRLTAEERAEVEEVEGETERRPRTRGGCEQMERPCPYVSCKFNLYLDVSPSTGSIKLNFPHLEPWELEESCVLDVADRGGVTLEEVGGLINLTRERVRQIEEEVVPKIKGCEEGRRLMEYLEGEEG